MRPLAGAAAGVALALLAACSEAPPANEGQIFAALERDLLRSLGDAAVVLASSDCGSDGETGAAIPAALFAALLEANDLGRHPPDALPARIRVLDAEESPRMLSARQRATVVALSRPGIAGVDALVCVEIFGTEDRGFFVLLKRTGDGRWSVHSEVEAWREAAPREREPEELPDGSLYHP